MTDHKAFNTINILSDLQSVDETTGAIVVNGGIGVGRNVYIGEDVNCGELIVRNDSRVGGSLYINGNLIAKSLFDIDEKDKDSLIFSKNLIPKDKQSLGTLDKKWFSINTHFLNCSQINITDKITINCDLVAKDCGGSSIMKIDHESQLVKIKQLVVSNDSLIKGDCISNNMRINNFVSIEPQIERINRNTKKIKIGSSTVLLMVDEEADITIVIDDEETPDNAIIRIVCKIVLDGLYIKINPRERVKILEPNHWIDIIIREGVPVYIGGSVRPA